MTSIFSVTLTLRQRYCNYSIARRRKLYSLQRNDHDSKHEIKISRKSYSIMIETSRKICSKKRSDVIQEQKLYVTTKIETRRRRLIDNVSTKQRSNL